MVPLACYIASTPEVIKVYKKDQSGDWSGLLWPGNSFDFPISKPGCEEDSNQCGPTNVMSQAILFLGVTASLLLVFSIAGVLILQKHRYTDI